MDMEARNQYLKKLQEEYLKAPKRQKGILLDEAEKRTELSRKYLIRKLSPNHSWQKRSRKKKKEKYDKEFVLALRRMWEIFDYPCGQRLAPLLKTETDRLRIAKELSCSEEVARKLKEVSFRTIDEKLKRTKELEGIKRKYPKRANSLLYQKIPVKLSDDLDRSKLGNIQIDLVEHCGQSTAGEYLVSLSTVDIYSGWWEAEAVMGKGQYRTFKALELIKKRFPFPWKEIHSDNGSEFINWHLFKYTQKESLGFSRSRSFKKNDNCFVEQKNWTHVKKQIGYYRYDTQEEQILINTLYRDELRLYKNFFQPIIKLLSKERIGGKIKRVYAFPKTPYQSIMESKDVPEETKKRLTKIYLSLNPAQLKREIEAKVDLLYQTYQEKKKSLPESPKIIKKLKPFWVTYYIAQPKHFRLPSYIA